jgi:hypothetical protein
MNFTAGFIALCSTALSFAALGFAAPVHAADPVIDNERLTVWDTTSALPPAQHDFVAVFLSRKGTAFFGHKGDIPSKDGERTVVIELKDQKVAPIANETNFPPAFPRPRSTKLLENDRVVVWNYAWRTGVPTPMHFHDKDALVVYEATGALQSTTPDGKSVVNEYKFGDIRFNRRDRVHTERLVKGRARAVITELK